MGEKRGSTLDSLPPNLNAKLVKIGPMSKRLAPKGSPIYQTFAGRGGEFRGRGGEFSGRGCEFSSRGGEFSGRGGEFSGRGGEFIGLIDAIWPQIDQKVIFWTLCPDILSQLGARNSFPFTESYEFTSIHANSY
jgi:hypothetical protein